MFLGLLILCCVGLAPTAPAVAAEEPLIAVILPNDLPRYWQIQTAFLPALQSACGTGCRVYVQTPNADRLSLRNSVRKAVALDARLIVTYGTAATSAARSENPGLPILFADVPDPEALTYDNNKSLVGNNMTGVRGDAPLPALLSFFLEATKAGSLAILYEKDSVEGSYQRNTLLQVAKRRNVAVMELVLDDDDDIVTRLKSLPSHIDGLYLAHGERLSRQLQDVIATMKQQKIPVISQIPGSAELGAFMSLETDAAEQGEKLAVLAGQMLRSKKAQPPAIIKPRQVAFVVNLKAAHALHLQVPLQTLAAATRIVR